MFHTAFPPYLTESPLESPPPKGGGPFPPSLKCELETLNCMYFSIITNFQIEKISQGRIFTNSPWLVMKRIGFEIIQWKATVGELRKARRIVICLS